MAGAGAGGDGAGREAAGRVADGRAAAGVGRRTGLAVVSFGAVTVTSGSVAAACPQAHEAHKPGSGKAPHATAAKSRRFQPDSDLRRRPNVPNMTPPDVGTKLPVANRFVIGSPVL
jgi:hypothetical protein